MGGNHSKPRFAKRRNNHARERLPQRPTRTPTEDGASSARSPEPSRRSPLVNSPEVGNVSSDSEVSEVSSRHASPSYITNTKNSPPRHTNPESGYNSPQPEYSYPTTSFNYPQPGNNYPQPENNYYPDNMNQPPEYNYPYNQPQLEMKSEYEIFTEKLAAELFRPFPDRGHTF